MQIKLSKRIFNFLFLFFLFSSTLQAKSENLISLDKVIENVLIHHPELKEKMAMIDVSKAEIVDHTSILTLNGLVEDYKDNFGTVKVEGFNNHKQLGHAPTSTRILKLS